MGGGVAQRLREDRRAAAHDVDVVNVAEYELGVGVQGGVLCALAQGHVDGGGHLAPSVQDVQFGQLVLSGALLQLPPLAAVQVKQPLIRRTVLVPKTHHGLRGPQQHCAIVVHIRDRRYAAATAEFRSSLCLRGGEGLGQYDILWVGGAEGVVGVGNDLPLILRADALSLVLPHDVARLPALLSTLEVGEVLKREEWFLGEGLGQQGQQRVRIGGPVLRPREGYSHSAVVFAHEVQGAARRGGVDAQKAGEWD
mmetsp:Transcript_27130/g.60005  ORF Transcript_27130/g.60005 Transcript_27130/m.60005 type:complete len:253 (+) Transcript_27130:1114-1872(+)